MRHLGQLGWAIVTLAMACSSKEADAERIVDSASSSALGTVETSPGEGSHASGLPYTGNIVAAGGRVLIDIGTMKGVRGADPIKHISERGIPGVSNDRVYLRTSVFDQLKGVQMEFELNYLDETGPIELIENGTLNYQEQEQGPLVLATAGTVTVLREANGPWKLVFDNLKMGELREADFTVPSAESLPSGTIVGDVERFCTVGLERDPSNPFCQVQK